MTHEEIRLKLEAHDYLFYFFDPDNFDHSHLARLFISLRDPDKAKKLIFHWVWISYNCQKKFKPETIQLLEATGRIVAHCGGKWFSNLWELKDFTKGLHDTSKFMSG